MTIYYIEQDDTVWGCGDPECCGEYYEDITHSFVKCECEQVEPGVEPDMVGHLQACNGGGPVLKWRKAKRKEVQAFEDGYSEGHSDGWGYGIEWQKKAEANKALRILRPIEEMTVNELVKEGYVITVDGESINKPKSVHFLDKE